MPDRRYLVPLGDLDPVRAAPLADAGVTPYRAVRRAAPWLGEGGTALVIGAGGLGQFAIQYVRRLTKATRTVVVEPDPRKRERATELGAEEAHEPGAWTGSARVVLDFVGTDASLAEGAARLERGGLLVLVGEAGGSLPFGFRGLPYEGTLTTSILGSLHDLRAVVGLAQAGELEWSVETLPLRQANEALDRLRAGDVEGRLVLVP